MSVDLYNSINNMDILLDGSYDDCNIDFNNDIWLSDIFSDHILTNDRLMTDAVSEISEIKSEACMTQDDILSNDLASTFELTDDLDKKPLLSSSSSSGSSPPQNDNDVPFTISAINPRQYQQHPSSSSYLTFNSVDSSSSSSSSTIGNIASCTSSTNNGGFTSTLSRSADRGTIRTGANTQRVQVVMRHPQQQHTAGTSGYLHSSVGAASMGSHCRSAVISKVKRQDSYYVSDRYDDSPASVSGGYVLYPPTPPGSSNSSSDSEHGGGGSLGRECDDRSSVYPMTCYPSGHHRSASGYGMAFGGHQPSFQSPIPQSGVLILTDEEKRTLISEGYSIPNRLPLTKQEERNLKKVRRKIKNKISAQESRRKKKEYVETLEKRVEAYSHENIDLKRRMDTLENNNRSLLSQLRQLQQLSSKASGTAASSCLMVLVLCFAVFLAGAPHTDGGSGAASSVGSRLHQVGYAVPSRLNKGLPPSALPSDGGAYSRRLARLRRFLPTYAYLPPSSGGAADEVSGGPAAGAAERSGSGIGPLAPDHVFSAGEAAGGEGRGDDSSQRLSNDGTPIGPHIQDPRISEGTIGRSRLLGSAKEDSEECVRAYGPNYWWSFLMMGQQSGSPRDEVDHLVEAGPAPGLPQPNDQLTLYGEEEGDVLTAPVVATMGNLTVVTSHLQATRLVNWTSVTLA